MGITDFFSSFVSNNTVHADSEPAAESAADSEVEVPEEVEEEEPEDVRPAGGLQQPLAVQTGADLALDPTRHP